MDKSYHINSFSDIGWPDPGFDTDNKLRVIVDEDNVEEKNKDLEEKGELNEENINVIKKKKSKKSIIE